MWDIIKTILASPAGSFAFVFSILALCFWGVHKLTKYVTKWECRLEKVNNLESSIKEASIDIISRNWDRILNLIEQQQLTNPYDIQQFCIDKATIAQDELFSKEDVDSIKKFAFSEGLPTAYYGGMFGVLIRNQYFKVKGIDVSDVDRHDPNQNK